MPLKKSVRAKRSTRSGRSPRLKKLVRVIRGTTPMPIIVVAICVLAAAMMLAAFEPSDSAAVSRDASSDPAAQALPNTAAPAATPAPTNTSAEFTAKPVVDSSRWVTITGCLQRKDEMFRLTDTSGADAPRARSWKSAFLKKGAASIEVVDSTNRAKLHNHIGTRVSVSGTLTNREMQVRSIRRVAASCGDASKVKI